MHADHKMTSPFANYFPYIEGEDPYNKYITPLHWRQEMTFGAFEKHYTDNYAPSYKENDVLINDR